MSLDALRSLLQQECDCEPYESACPRCVKLAALATHIPALAEALEKCAGKLAAQDIREKLPPSAELDKADDVLKALQEALDE